MQTKTIAGIGIVILLLAAGGTYFVKSRNTTNNTPPKSAVTNLPDSSGTTPVPGQTARNRYLIFSESAFESAKGKKRVYFFFAPWCPTCVPADGEFAANSGQIPEDVVLFRVDYDTATELKKRYGITYQHTFVLVDDYGNEIKKWNGGTMEALTANTQ